MTEHWNPSPADVAKSTCRCGDPTRNDGSDYADVCAQWPRCEQPEGTR